MKKSNVKIHRKNNNGSTLIIVLTIMAFLSILAVVVTSSSIVNLKMKHVDSESSKAFYTAEDAIDEIYAALGKVSMESFDEAYNEELSSVVKQISVGGTDVTYALSNLTSNDNLRKNFTYKLLSKLSVLPETSVKYSDEYYVKEYIMPEEIEAFVSVLNSFLEESEEMLKVTSVDGISVKKTMSDANKSLFTYTFSFRNCSVKYLNESSYYSDIVFDGKIAMPDVFIEFSSEADYKKEFTQYALIGNTGLNIDKNKALNLKGNVYAGKMLGIKVNEGSKFTSNSNIKIVSGGDINVSDGEMNLTSTEVWCNNIFATGNKSSKIYIKGGYTFVKDDLQLDGDNSIVEVGGNYYGYGYQGFNKIEGNHNNSSSIIVNGNNAILDLSYVDTLVIGGRAYIDYNSLDKNYATGESLSLKGSQEIYLVPSMYFKKGTNPTAGKDVDVEISLTEDNFFGYKYLNKGKPYISKTITTETGEVTFYYLNFIDDKASSDYVKAIFDDNIDDESRKYVKDVIKKNISSFLGGGKVISASKSATVYTNGQLIQAETKDNPKLGETDNDYNVEGNNISTDGFALDAWDLSNRYSLMTKILVAPEFKDKDGNRNYLKKVGDKIIIDRKEYDISGYAENNIFENVISIDNFYKLTSENSSGYFKTLDGGSILCAINNGVPIEVSDEDSSPFKGYNQGVIVASGDVIVKKNFSGTILTDGKIIISGDNVTVDNVINGSSVEKLIQENQDFSVIFNAFAPLISDSENNKLNSITYKDFVEFENWRKSYE